MSKIRRHYSSGFKAKVALAALKGNQITIGDGRPLRGAPVHGDGEPVEVRVAGQRR